MTELEYWNSKKVDKVSTKKEGWRFMLSERRIGKTTMAARWIHERALKGERTALVRTKKTEIMGCVDGYANMINKHYPGENYTAKRNDLSADLIDSKGHICAKCFALTTYSDARGGGLEGNMLIQDEMIPEDRNYIVKDPYHSVLSIQSSACNGEGFIWSFGNRVSSVNPYFARMRIYAIDDRDVSVWPGIATIEICRGYKVATPKDAPISGAQRAGNFEGLYTEEHDNLKDFIIKPTKGYWSTWSLFVGGHFYALCQQESKYIWGKSNEKSVSYVVASKDLARGRELLPQKLKDIIKTDFTRGRMYFESLNTMMDIVGMVFSEYKL